MRCFFLKNGHVVGVEMLPGLSDQEAIAKSYELFFDAPRRRYDGFEVWQMSRFVMRHEEASSLPPFSLRPSAFPPPDPTA
jgi:hypothetical protein